MNTGATAVPNSLDTWNVITRINALIRYCLLNIFVGIASLSLATILFKWSIRYFTHFIYSNGMNKQRITNTDLRILNILAVFTEGSF